MLLDNCLHRAYSRAIVLPEGAQIERAIRARQLYSRVRCVASLRVVVREARASCNDTDDEAKGTSWARPRDAAGDILTLFSVIPSLHANMRVCTRAATDTSACAALKVPCCLTTAERSPTTGADVFRSYCDIKTDVCLHGSFVLLLVAEALITVP